MSGEARWPPEVLRAGGGVRVEVGTAGHVWQSNIYIYKGACSLAQAKGLSNINLRPFRRQMRCIQGGINTKRKRLNSGIVPVSVSI